MEKYIFFADNMCLLFERNHSDHVYKSAERKPHQVIAWSADCQCGLNTLSFFCDLLVAQELVLHFCRRYNVTVRSWRGFMEGVDKYKYQGVVIDKRLSSLELVQYLNNKLWWYIYMLVALSRLSSSGSKTNWDSFLGLFLICFTIVNTCFNNEMLKYLFSFNKYGWVSM